MPHTRLSNQKFEKILHQLQYPASKRKTQKSLSFQLLEILLRIRAGYRNRQTQATTHKAG